MFNSIQHFNEISVVVLDKVLENFYKDPTNIVWNVENKICGATDSPLTEHGIEQATETERYILENAIQADEILYSPLSRATDTAKIISVSFSVTKLWLTKFGAYAKKDKIQVQYFDPVTAELVSTEMYVDGYKANPKKDTSYKGLWTVGFTVREM